MECCYATYVSVCTQIILQNSEHIKLSPVWILMARSVGGLASPNPVSWWEGQTVWHPTKERIEFQVTFFHVRTIVCIKSNLSNGKTNF